MRPFLFLALLVAHAPAAPVPKGLKKQPDDTEQMVGRWITTTGSGHSFEYRADGTMKVWNGPNEGNSGVPYRWTVDGTASPKRMTWYDTSSTPPRPQFECLYEMEGDSLKITYESHPTVPKGIGQGSHNHTMTRQAPAK